MNKKGQFRIALFGFEREERNALASLFALTGRRRREYQLVEHNDRGNADITLVFIFSSCGSLFLLISPLRSSAPLRKIMFLFVLSIFKILASCQTGFF